MIYDDEELIFDLDECEDSPAELDYAHAIEDQALTPVELDYIRLWEERQTTIWMAKNGEEIALVDLTNAHLRNIIFYLNKRFGQIKQGRDNSDMNCSTIMDNTPNDFWPIYDYLRKEANRRKLTWI